MNAQDEEEEKNFNFEEFSESSSEEEEYCSEFSESRSMNEKKNNEKKGGLKFASVPYRVNPETNYSGVSGSNLMPDITNANLTPSH
jgi:hypothetical protein